jgi:predicted ATPase
MKIDIHVHTKKTKQGDAETREINASKFAEIIGTTDVKIVAITNHNSFDYSQYILFRDEVGQDIQIWPGVELDISEGTHRAHLLVIVSPQKAMELSQVMNCLTLNKSPNTFSISIDDVLANFDNLGSIYIAHYHKKPDLLDESIAKLFTGTKNKNRILKEVTNSISAGIYISHGHGSIYGSDVQDWNQYESIARDLPDLRLPVESFDHFCLLLEKDKNTINTILDRKATETLVLQPFEDNSKLELKVYNDINVLFGSKGTGKSKILQAIAKHYKDKGVSADVFESGSDRLDLLYDLKGNEFSIDFKDYGVDYCTNEIADVKSSVERDIANLSSYYQFYSTESRNKNAQKIKIKDFPIANIQIMERKYLSINKTQKKMQEFLEFIKSEKPLRENINEGKLNALKDSLASVINDLEVVREQAFVDFKINQLYNNLIAKVKSEIARKTGTPEKPSTTGFLRYALNRINMEVNASKIYVNLQAKIELPSEYVGSLGAKGDLHCKTEVVIQDGTITDGKLDSISKVAKTPQKEFARKIKEIINNVYSTNLYEKITSLNAIETSESITSIYELSQFKRYFTINGKTYDPSNGEVSMLLLHKELSSDKDIYILDEPEKSLGNDYINDEIVPLIKEKAKMGKKIFISTHNANIAVRTLPYSSIYRKHNNGRYDTFVGNPFSNNLVNILTPGDELDWKHMSMKTLEGGKEAFGERGKIYGNI